ncbi:MAG: deaminase [Patescibacteria group bacterium]
MDEILRSNDEECLHAAINIARKTYIKGNYPVGAVLAINGQIVDQAGNEISQQKSFVSHAENSLIIRNGTQLYEAWENKKEISLYSTLEPCIQCLGASVTNHINKIFYIQKDPNGGACDLNHDNIGLWYKKTWPLIVYSPISTEPLDMMLKYFRSEIEKGNTKWPTKMIQLLEM